MLQKVQEKVDAYQANKRYKIILISLFKENKPSFDTFYYGYIKYKIIDSENKKATETWPLWVYNKEKLPLNTNRVYNFRFEHNDDLKRYAASACLMCKYVNEYSCWETTSGDVVKRGNSN
jgi:hypothetical protein